MDQFQVKMSAWKENDKIVIRIRLDDAEVTMKYKNQDSISVIAENLDRILEYMWTDYLVRKEFSEQLDELESWLNDGNNNGFDHGQDY